MPSIRYRIAVLLVRLNTLIQMEAFTPIRYQRWWFDGVVPRLATRIKGVRYEALDISGMPAEWAIPQDARDGQAILYLHGGAYVVGSIASHRMLVSQLAKEAGCRALAVEYRLAPENPFPAAVEDAVKVYEWLIARGYKAGNTVLAGDSAGGGLAVAAMLSLRDAGSPMPAAAMLLSPWTDMEVSGDCVKNVRDDPMLSARALRREAAMYLGGEDPRHPLASPIYAELYGLPTMLIQAGTREILLDDARRLAERAREAGTEVELDVWEGMFHVWQFFAPLVPESNAAVAKLGRYAREKMAAGA
ncbi:MAG: alpha/beta hydrolase [Actinobacteria bacterium]|jgi:acetyl esterase/lipase|nr:MAG: alpha/beta hydrolase [Actinomycetota bacterium]